MRGVIGTRHARVEFNTFHSGSSAEKHFDPRPPLSDWPTVWRPRLRTCPCPASRRWRWTRRHIRRPRPARARQAGAGAARGRFAYFSATSHQTRPTRAAPEPVPPRADVLVLPSKQLPKPGRPYSAQYRRRAARRRYSSPHIHASCVYRRTRSRKLTPDANSPYQLLKG